MKFNVPGNPVPKPRPKFFSKGKFVRVYTPAQGKKYEALVAACCRKAMSGDEAEILTGPLTMTIKFYFARPKSKKAGTPHIVKPDIDNLAKSVLDGINKIAYGDDAQVTDLQLVKEYASDPADARAFVWIGPKTEY